MMILKVVGSLTVAAFNWTCIHWSQWAYAYTVYGIQDLL